MNRFRIADCGLRIVDCRFGIANCRFGIWDERRHTLIWTIVMLILLSITSAHAMSGREVYEKLHEVAKKSLDHKMDATMILFDKGGGTRSRTLVAYAKRDEAEAYKVLMLFKTPPDLKDVGFLIHARSFADRDLWAYFPEFKKIRRIPTSSQDDSFFGTDFSYDDFGGPANLDDYSFKILREEVVDGKPCFVVEVTPKIHRKYTRYVSWVAKDLWIYLRLEYYQEKELYREGAFTDVRMIDDIPTAFKGLMANRKSGHKTEFTLEDVQYHTSFPDDLFTQRSLERAGK